MMVDKEVWTGRATRRTNNLLAMTLTLSLSMQCLAFSPQSVWAVLRPQNRGLTSSPLSEPLKKIALVARACTRVQDARCSQPITMLSADLEGVFAAPSMRSHGRSSGVSRSLGGSLLALSMSGTVRRRRRQGSSGQNLSVPTDAVGKMVALFAAAVRWFLELLRDVYGQFFVLTMDTLIQKPFLFILNKVHIEQHTRLTDLIGKRGRKTPLITVSNHCSSLDEPLLFSALIPWPILQWQLRWSLCNDDMFFKLGNVFAQLFFYAARGLPIWRNRSMDQPSFQEFCTKARKGGWCHIFPEGRIWQPWKLNAEGRRLGPLRPGVGKLIAHCEETDPVVLPFYHTGMHRVLPQVPNSRAQSFPPKTGNTLRIRIGEPIPVGDLLKEYRERREAARKTEGITDGWTTTAVDEELYEKLTQRVESALLELSKQVDPGLEWQTHPSVLPGGEYFQKQKKNK